MKDLNYVKRIFNFHFKRELTDEEAQAYYNKVSEETKKRIEEVPGYSKDKLAYLVTQGDIFFSPVTLIKELKKSADEKPPSYQESKEYIELWTGFHFCIATKLLFDTDWLVHLSDSPDLKLFAPGSTHWDKKQTYNFFLEVLQLKKISELIHGVDNGKLLGKHIKQNKFKKRYSKGTNLIVNVRDNNFTKNEFMRSSAFIRYDKTNPYQYIFATNLPKYEGNLQFVRLHPTFSYYEIDLSNKTIYNY